MKILLSWLLDYLDCTWSDIDIDHLVHLFNTRTAEIESYEKVVFDKNRFFVAQVKKIEGSIKAFCPELETTLVLSGRTDAVVEKWYIVVLDGDQNRWASLQDFASSKEGLMPAVFIKNDEDGKGGWKKSIPSIDYVLDVDNKSINHRPDLWGHYGIAREIAAFLNVDLHLFDQVLEKLKVQHFKKSSEQSKDLPISILLQAEPCSRVASLVCDNVQYQDSAAWMAIRLARVDSKPINAVVDITNYVMLDAAHPMHAFDGQAFADKKMIVRMAQAGEKLELLDGQNISLNAADIVIANDEKAVSLAGIMGGKASGYQMTTKNVVLEAAGFDPVVIRKSVQRCKIRTEASARFEKYVDPMQNITAIQRFVFLAKKLGVLSDVKNPIISIGLLVEPKECSLSHQFVQSQLGMPLQPDVIQKTLKKLGFGVVFDEKKQEYTVTIPTYRLTKDIKIQQDLVEEIIRSYGFENIVAQLPMRQMQPFSMQIINNVDHIKHHLAFALHMHELRDYLLYDAAFVNQLEIDTTHAIRVKNPLSENWTTLVTSLIPHLLKAVQSNAVSHDSLRFFEYNCIWHKNSEQLIEQKSLSGIIFDKQHVDFYQSKAELESLFDLLKLHVVWKKPTHAAPVWYDLHQTAELYVGNIKIGYAGMMSAMWMHNAVKGSAFIFELDGEFLAKNKLQQIRFKSWSKFQEVCYDISLLIPLKISVDEIKQAIVQADKHIVSVHLVDFFEKPEWNDQRAITLRYVMSDQEKTMTKVEIDEIVQKVQTVMVKYGAQIR